MGKALIISDTHGLHSGVTKLVSRYPFEIMFHCGDYCVDPKLDPFNRMVLVKGNNDRETNIPDDQVVEWNGIRFFITHGHHYSVNSSLIGLKYKALEASVDVVLFGHTHYPLCLQDESLIYVNPGSLKNPRGFAVPTFVVLDVQDGPEKRELSFTYYNTTLKEVPKLSSVFQLLKK